MSKRIKATGGRARTIRSTTVKARRIDPGEVARALGAEIVGSAGNAFKNTPRIAGLRQRLFTALRSSGGRPSLEGTARRQKIPMSDEDWKSLEAIAASLSSKDLAPAPGQVASQLLHDAIQAYRAGPRQAGGGAELVVAEAQSPAYKPGRGEADRSVTNLPIRGLDLLFAPPGLPLVDKGARQPTTSVLLFGDAGAGKTTLAIALGHAIARHLGGSVLYLTTELAPTELRHKLELLGLSDVPVLSWEEPSGAPSGALVAGHLGVVDADRPTSVRERALQAAWDFVVKPTEQSAFVRCVVIDAFPLVEAGESPRDAMVLLLQALESRGISVVMVQEAGGSSDYLPFVVDVVFELRFVEARDTGELVRKLGCRKSRYSRSLVGPHATGLDRGAVAVWPSAP